MQSPQQWLPRLIAFLCLGLAACGRPDGYSEELLVQGAIDDHALVRACRCLLPPPPPPSRHRP